MADTGCCPKGSEPALAATYVAKGTESKLGDLSIYTIGTGNTAIIVNNDIYGFNGGRIRLICDQLANDGYFVILPDYFRGDSYPADAEIEPNRLGEFLKKHSWAQVKSDLEDKVYPYLKGEKSIEKFAMIGFCWGAWVNLHASVNEEVVCAANVHPAFNLENFHGKPDNDVSYFFENKEAELTKLVKCPQLIYSASNDLPSIKGDGEIIKILKEKPFGDNCVFRDFPDVVHGFATRGDLEKPEVARDVKIVMEGVADFFKANFSA